MRIVVANLTSGGLSGGYRKYLERLMPLMAGDPRVSQLTVFVPTGAQVRIDSRVDVRPWPPRDARRGYAELAAEVARLRADVVFVPTARYARFGGTPVATMVRNMEPLTVPFGGNRVAEGIRNVLRAWEARRASRRAARVLAVSEHVRHFIVSHFHVDASRVGLVYHGVDPVAPAGAPAQVGRPATLFTAGSIRPARGLEDVLRALPLVDSDMRLTIAGMVDAHCERYVESLRRMCIELGIADRVTWAGPLDAGGMTGAFRACTLFVMTSRAEACPNIALEAMSCGCASVSVDRAPMPEFFSDAAQYYPAGDAQTLADRIRNLLQDDAVRDGLSRAAERRARTFTWERTSARTIEELQRTLS